MEKLRQIIFWMNQTAEIETKPSAILNMNINETSEKFLRKHAEGGDSIAQYKLALLMLENDPCAALSLLNKSAEKNYSDAQFELGKYYEEGKGITTVNMNKAISYYKMAAKNGHIDAIYKLIELSKVLADDSAVAAWYLLAAKYGDAEAMYKIGMRYLEGIGITKSSDDAIYFFEKARESNYFGAKEVLAKYYAMNKNINDNLAKAYNLYLDLAQDGNGAAQCWLGEYFSAQEQNLENIRRAIIWFEKIHDSNIILKIEKKLANLKKLERELKGSSNKTDPRDWIKKNDARIIQEGVEVQNKFKAPSEIDVRIRSTENIKKPETIFSTKLPSNLENSKKLMPMANPPQVFAQQPSIKTPKKHGSLLPIPKLG